MIVLLLVVVSFVGGVVYGQIREVGREKRLRRENESIQNRDV